MNGGANDKMWGGRFDRGPDELFYDYQRSFSYDRRLLPYQLAVDRAWAKALQGAGILKPPEVEQILDAIERIARHVEANPAWLDASKAEDVHHFAETALIERLGPLGARVHTGRSRNELVVTEFRMFIKDAAREMRRATAALIDALVTQAEKNFDVPMPGNTHLQHAQPILFPISCWRTPKAFSTTWTGWPRRGIRRTRARWGQAQSPAARFRWTAG